MAEKMRVFTINGEIKRPIICEKCGGILVYSGLGEYRCGECHTSEFDDYGKVRSYLEKHRGANVTEISDETGVSHKSIRDMVKENRFEVIEGRNGYLKCEACGASIKSGRLCHNCEQSYHKEVEQAARNERQRNMSGYGEGPHEDKGSKRFTRDR